MTETGKRDLQEYLKVPPDKIHVVPEAYNPLCRPVDDPAVLARARGKYRLPGRYVLFVGGITPLKNLPVLLRALARLGHDDPDLRLVLSGFKRWKFADDLALITSLGLRDRVVETGYVDDEDIPALYALARCFVLPSFYEGFGIPILEAQACGCPVVAASAGAMPEVAGGAALHFDPRNDEELAAAIRRVLDDPALRSSLVAAGFENAARYSWRTTAAATLRLFESLGS
jgi:glycosyltransferase involved in cell wall biosynthesis